jgi:hypothetical protein
MSAIGQARVVDALRLSLQAARAQGRHTNHERVHLLGDTQQHVRVGVLVNHWRPDAAMRTAASLLHIPY